MASSDCTRVVRNRGKLEHVDNSWPGRSDPRVREPVRLEKRLYKAPAGSVVNLTGGAERVLFPR